MPDYLATIRAFDREADRRDPPEDQPSWFPDRVTLGNRHFPLAIWDGQQLESELIAIDTETEVVTGPTIPRLAMVQVPDGATHCILHPRDLPRFLQQHDDATFTGHNVAGFDWWVLSRQLEDTNERWSLDVLWGIVDQGRLRDTMIRARLLQLATEGECPRDVGLAALAKRYLGVDLAKDDTRQRFAEALDQPWDKLDRELFVYAGQDVIATHLVAVEQDQEIQRLIQRYRISAEKVRRFGPLSERIQIWGMIALQAMHRFGVCVDRKFAARAESSVRHEVETAARHVERVAGTELFLRDNSQLVLQKQGYSRRGKAKALQEQFAAAASRLGVNPPTSSRGIRTDRTFWQDFQDKDNFVSAWFEYQLKATELKFYANLQTEQLHPRYDWLKRTGRTSCMNPNMQNAPRSGEYRQCIVPRRGHVFLIADFKAIEMATLAKACLVMLGESRLAEVLQQGQDVHAFTAAMMKGWSSERFRKFAEEHPAEAKAMRQAAKAINFGCPGGLGATRLQEFARRKPYFVELTIEEAQERKKELIHRVYPELARFLEEDPHKILAWNLHVDRDRVVQELGEHLGPVRRVVEGEPYKSDGTRYRAQFIDRVWATLSPLNENPRWVQPLAELDCIQCSKLFRAPTVTTTGRIRNYAGYCDWRNTRFQGPASCGAKLCLYALIRAGHRPVLFVHDEVVCEVPDDRNLTSAVEEIIRICEEQMRVITDPVPVSMEYAVARRWYKDAELVRDRNGKIIAWQPTGAQCSE